MKASGVIRTRGGLFSLAVLFGTVAGAPAQVLDNPAQVPLFYQGEVLLEAWQGGGYPEATFFWNGSSLGYAQSYFWSDHWFDMGASTLSVTPGQVYTLTVEGAGALDYKVRLNAPPGYRVHVDYIARNEIGGTGTLGYVDQWWIWHDSVHYQVVVTKVDEEESMYSGQAGTLATHAVIWQVGLGQLLTGAGAGRLQLRHADFNSAVFTPAGLSYAPPDPSVEVIRVAGQLRQIRSPESLADIVVASPTSYHIRFYAPANVGSKSGGIYQVSNNPFVQYTLSRVGTDNEHLQIVQTRGSTSWTASLQKSGTGWTRRDWSSGSNFRQEVQTGSGSTVTRTVSYSDTPQTKAVERTLTYQTRSWGQELGSTHYPGKGTTSYGYHDDAGQPGNLGRLAWVERPDQSWVKYNYYNDLPRRGLLYREFRPWKDAPASLHHGVTENTGDVITWDYVHNPESGRQDRPSLRERRINGTLAGRTQWSYTNPGALNGRLTVEITRQDWVSPTQSVSSVHRRHRHDLGDGLYRGMVLMERRPDGTQTSYAYERGTYNPSTGSFTSGAGPDVRVSQLTGTGSANGGGGSQINSLYSQAIVPVHPVPHESELRVMIRYRDGRIKREEAHVYTGGTSFALVEATQYTHTACGRVQTIHRVNVGGSGTRPLYESSWSNGHKVNETDAQGVVTNFTYDIHRRLASRTHTSVGQDGVYPTQPAVLTSYTYDAADRLTHEQIGSSHHLTREWAYDNAGRVTSFKEARPGSGHYTTATAYSDSTRTVTTTFPGGATRIETRYRDGRLRSVGGTAQVSEFYDYGWVPAGDFALYTEKRYSSGNNDEWFNLFTDWIGRDYLHAGPSYFEETNPDANRLIYHVYNNSGQLVRIRNASNAFGQIRADEVFAYTGWGRLHRRGLDLNNNEHLDPSSHDRIEEETHRYEFSGGHWWRLAQSEVYRQASSTAKTTIFHQRIRLTGLSATTIGIVEQLDANGNVAVTTTTLNRGQRLLLEETNYPDATITARVRVRNGRIEEERSRTGTLQQFVYDSYGRISEVRGRNSVQTRYLYATSGTSNAQTRFVATIQSHNGSAWFDRESMTYDAAGRVSLRTHIGGTGHADRTERFLYNHRGQVTHHWGTGVTPVRYDYNSYGRLTHQRLYRGGGPWDQPTWPSNPGTADTTQYVYQARTGLLLEKIDPAGRKTTYTYNIRHQLATRVQARGITTTYTYYENESGPSWRTGELKSVSHSDGTPTVTYTYNRFGAPATVADATGTRTFTYRNDLQLHEEQLPGFYGSSRVIRPTYATSGVTGRRTGVQYGPTANPGANYQASYGFDSATGRVNSITGSTSGQSRTLNYSYQGGSDMLAGITSGSYQRQYTWETWRDVLKEVNQTWNSNIRARQVYDISGHDQYTKETATGLLEVENGRTNGRSTDWTYGTKGDMLTHVVKNGSTTLYSQTVARDQQLNRTSLTSPLHGAQTTYSINNLNQYTSASGGLGGSFTHDLDGNLTGTGSWSYVYDAQNRLKEAIQLPVQTGSLKVEYTYDYLGRRVEKRRFTRSGSSYQQNLHHKYVYQGWDLLAIVEGGNGTTLLQTFTWGPTAGGGWGGAGGLALAWTSNAHHLPLTDGRQNILGYVDSAGNISQKAEFDAFGQFVLPSQPTTLTFGFTWKGYFYDADVELYYLGYRFYSPKTGRFLTRDPIGEAGGLNLYAHVRGDAINHYDILGLSQNDGRDRPSIFRWPPPIRNFWFWIETLGAQDDLPGAHREDVQPYEFPPKRPPSTGIEPRSPVVTGRNYEYGERPEDVAVRQQAKLVSGVTQGDSQKTDKCRELLKRFEMMLPGRVVYEEHNYAIIAGSIELYIHGQTGYYEYSFVTYKTEGGYRNTPLYTDGLRNWVEPLRDALAKQKHSEGVAVSATHNHPLYGNSNHFTGIRGDTEWAHRNNLTIVLFAPNLALRMYDPSINEHPLDRKTHRIPPRISTIEGAPTPAEYKIIKDCLLNP